MFLEDCRANSWSLRPCCMVLAYRIAHFCSVWRKKNVLNNLWAAPVLVLYRIITECFFGYEIQAAATIGRRFTIHHGYAVVINKFVVAGDDFTGGYQHDVAFFQCAGRHVFFDYVRLQPAGPGILLRLF